MSPPFPSPPSPPSFFFSSHSLSGRAASEGPIPQGTAPAETGSGSSYNSEWIANHQGGTQGQLPPRSPRARLTGASPRALFARSEPRGSRSISAGPAWASPVTRAGEQPGWKSWGCSRSGLRCAWPVLVCVRGFVRAGEAWPALGAARDAAAAGPGVGRSGVRG